jgi:hypothetical protein
VCVGYEIGVQELFSTKEKAIVWNIITSYVVGTQKEIAYDVVEDIEIEMNHVIEDDILDNEDIDIEYDVFIDENVVEDNEDLSTVVWRNLLTLTLRSLFLVFLCFYIIIIYLHGFHVFKIQFETNFYG